MGYRLEAQEKLSTGIKRIAQEQADKALTHLTASGEDQGKAIHEARKCFKKIRAELEAAARPLGERIYAEKPRRFVKRVAAYWHLSLQVEIQD